MRGPTRRRLLRVQLLALLLGALAVSSARGAETLCAEVQIEIVQELAFERQAFDARMRINNGLDTLDLDNVEIEVFFETDQGTVVGATTSSAPSSALFFMRLDQQENISVSGESSGAPAWSGGPVSAATSAEIRWLIIPTAGAAMDKLQGQAYRVGARVEYDLGGEHQEIEVTPDIITVKPQPSLQLDYFLTQQIRADDPDTPGTVEPTEPFTLGTRILNNGIGLAGSVTIESAQPEIVDNDQQLLVDFRITSSFVDDQPAAPTLLLNFGDIGGGGGSKVGRWVMETTLSGEFTKFTAEVAHADELGGRLTSLVEGASTHFLIRDVIVDTPGNDGIRDFLAYDDGSSLELAQKHVYESNGAGGSVTDQSKVGGNYRTLGFLRESGGSRFYEVTIPPTAGPLFVRLPNPEAGGDLVVRRVVRSDGKVLPSANAWSSTERQVGGGDLELANFFDVDGGGDYEIEFGARVAGPEPPAVQCILGQEAAEGDFIGFIVLASDPNGDSVSWSADRLPINAELIDRGNGQADFRWQTVPGQAGIYPVTLTASDGSLTTKCTQTLTVRVWDGDGDGMADAWEVEHFGDTDRDGTGDYDGDGISDLDEYLNGTDPTWPEGAQTTVDIEWVPVGRTGNVCDPQLDGCFGTVDYPYGIGKFEVTNVQYASFLNAIASSDPNGLFTGHAGDIVRSGEPGRYTYLPVTGAEDKPVRGVSFYHAVRFANWLDNGQPSGAQGESTTERGAYSITSLSVSNNSVARGNQAVFAVASEDEWYKAAYFDPGTGLYHDYPAGSDEATLCTVPTSTPNRANCEDVYGGTSVVGDYSGSPSPWETYDQGGNVAEWTESAQAMLRATRGGGWNHPCSSPRPCPSALAAENRGLSTATIQSNQVGFRVVNLQIAPPVEGVARNVEPVVLTGADIPAWSGPAMTATCASYPNATEGPRNAHNGTENVPPATGVPVDQIAAFTWTGARFREIPVQVDERFEYCLLNSNSEYSSYSGTDKELTYAWDDRGLAAARYGIEAWRKTGGECTAEMSGPSKPDPVPTFDADDEIVFMAGDAKPYLAPAGIPLPAGVTQMQMVSIADPLNPGEVLRVYLGLQAGGSAFDLSNGYVSYVRDDDADEWIDYQSFPPEDPERLGTVYSDYGPNLRGTVCRSNYHPNSVDGWPRNSTDRFLRDGATISTDAYEATLSGRWMFRGLRIAEPGQPGVYGPDLVDRWKGRIFHQTPDSEIPIMDFRSEQTHWEADSAMLGELAGPIRAIREIWGAGTATNLTKTETYYRDAISYRYRIRANPFFSDGLYTMWDYNRDVAGKYYNALNSEGVDIDGENDDEGNLDEVSGFSAQLDVPDPNFSPPSALLQWEQVSGLGSTGSLVYISEVKGFTTLENPAIVPYYRDDACLDDGTGDDPVQRPWPGIPADDSRVMGGYCAAAGGSDPCLPGEYEALACTDKQGSHGAHGAHYLFPRDSDNFITPGTTTEIDVQQWQFVVPTGTTINVGESYGNVIVVPLQVEVTPYF